MREIVFDTETTGLSFSGGDRLVEIGCVELFNRVETGKTFHCYFNPQRAMAAEAEAVHGLGDAFLADKPLFAHKVEELLEFLGDSPLIAHNANFDFGFVNGELGLCSRAPLGLDRMIDTLVMARKKIPGAKHTLDALCVRFGVDRSRRVLHGALLDAQLLAKVYVELTGGRQIGLGLADEAEAQAPAPIVHTARGERPVRQFSPSAEELDRHHAFIAKMGGSLWADAH